MDKLLLDNVRVPGYGLTISQQMNIASDDLSGTSSSTAKAENGFKPKTFSVTVTIRFKDAADLTRLSQLAEGVKSKGQRTIYAVAHPTMRALNVTQVRFTDTFSVQPAAADLRAWTVSFSLAEYNSAAERMEARTAASTKTVAQTGTGTAVTDNPAAPEENNVPQTDFEKVLGNLDGLAGKLLGGG